MSRTKLFLVVAVLMTVGLSAGSALAVSVVLSSGWSNASYPAERTVNGVFGNNDMGWADPGATVTYDLGSAKVIRKMRITPPVYGGSDPSTYNPVSGTVEFTDGFDSVVYNWSAPRLESVGRTDYAECSFPDHPAYQQVKWTITSGGRVGEVWFIESPSIACWEMNQNAYYTNNYPMWRTVDGVATESSFGVGTTDIGGWGEPYVTYDLGESKSFYGFKMTARRLPGLNPQSGELWISDDPVVGYQKVADWTLPDLQDFAVGTVSLGQVAEGRYVQLRNLTVGDQWAEFDVLIVTPGSVTVDSWSGWDGAHPVFNTVDGVFGGPAFGGVSEQNAWVVYDFGSPRKISKMRLFPPMYGGFDSSTFNPQAGTLEFSNDKLTWTSAVQWTLPRLESTGRVDFAEAALPDPVTYRYVRLTIDNAAAEDIRVAEIMFLSSPTVAVWEANQDSANTNQYPVWKTCDGEYWDVSSYGSMTGDPDGMGSGYLTYDLGKTRMVYGFALKSRQFADCNPTAGSLWVSDDPVYGYVKVGDWTLENLSGQVTGAVNFGAANAKPGRYVQFRDTGGGSWNETTILATGLFSPNEIPSTSSVTIDGSLGDWADATWTALDQTYNPPAPTDIAEAYYAAKWNADATKIYVATKVRDTAQRFLDDYTFYSLRDAIEIYIHTTGTGPTDYSITMEDAQQYALGIMSSNHNAVWSVFGSNEAIPPAAQFSAAGKQDGEWLYYEVALTPFHKFSIDGSVAVVSPLSVGQVIGLDVAVVSHNGTAYTGMVSENGLTQKWNNYAAFALHTLATASVQMGSVSDAKKAENGTIVGFTGSVTADFGNYIYVEATDRSSGIRVDKAAHGVSVNQLVNVTGPIGTMSTGERNVAATDVSPAGGNQTILPLGLNNKSLGGGDFGGQAGVVDGTGLNNIGLFVKAWGTLTSIGGNLYTLNDGSGVGVTVQVLNGSVSGTPYAAVTGIMSCVKDGSDVNRRIIVKNAATDVQTF